ncbi:MAG TPA: zinc transporter ZupT [Clostridiales bacterium]|nr:zinc transporter ZupT [Clostridiales bacterium]HQP68866.1 zinc transporter ZupT [Clostridiales bacterium]
MDNTNIIFAFALTLFAGLSTGVGSVMAFLSKGFNPKFLAGSLGFSAGVMIYVSLVEIFDKARESLTGFYGAEKGYYFTTLSFFGGMALIAVIDKLVPSYENPHEPHCPADCVQNTDDKKLMRMGLFSALAIGIHNFPEGLATFISALQEPTLAISITAAIAIHNIPEGIAVSVPIYYATKSRKKAFWLSFLSGLSEPLGALIGYFIFRQFFGPAVFGVIFAGVAGIMVFISLDELLPTAEKYGEHHVAVYGLVSGMIVMAGSLLLFM